MTATTACKSSCKVVVVTCSTKRVTSLGNYHVPPCMETITLILLFFYLLEILLFLIHLFLDDLVGSEFGP